MLKSYLHPETKFASQPGAPENGCGPVSEHHRVSEDFLLENALGPMLAISARRS